MSITYKDAAGIAAMRVACRLASRALHEVSATHLSDA